MLIFLLQLQSEEARIAREVEAHEKRIRKELEKQDILRRKVQLLLFMYFSANLFFFFL
jgi:hypothetical protein